MRRPALLAALAALALGGCGAATEDEREFTGAEGQVVDQVDRLEELAGQRDTEAICAEVLSRGLAQRIAARSSASCATGLDDPLGDSDSVTLRVQDVRIAGSRATVRVESEAGSQDRVDELGFVREGEDWKLDSLGG